MIAGGCTRDRAPPGAGLAWTRSRPLGFLASGGELSARQRPAAEPVRARLARGVRLGHPQAERSRRERPASAAVAPAPAARAPLTSLLIATVSSYCSTIL